VEIGHSRLLSSGAGHTGHSCGWLFDQVPTLEPVTWLQSLGEPNSRYRSFGLENRKVALGGSWAATRASHFCQTAFHRGWIAQRLTTKSASPPLIYLVIFVVVYRMQGMWTAMLQTVMNASFVLADPDERRAPGAPFVSRGSVWFPILFPPLLRSSIPRRRSKPFTHQRQVITRWHLQDSIL